jgi:hypothetical protein
MNRRHALGALAALPLAAPAQVRTQAVTVTRLVRVFLELETALFEAERSGDRAALERLLVDDFEQRGAARPGRPMPRAEWLDEALRNAAAEIDLEQMAVHDRGQTAIVSFAARPAGRAGRFIVDVWVRVGADWRLNVRYVSALN